jgi:hypothetical protein
LTHARHIYLLLVDSKYARIQLTWGKPEKQGSFITFVTEGNGCCFIVNGLWPNFVGGLEFERP